MQVSHTGRGVSLDQVARTCGFAWAAEIRDMAGIDDLRTRLTVHDGVKFACIKITADTPPRVLPPRDGVTLAHEPTASKSACGAAPAGLMATILFNLRRFKFESI